MDLHVYSSQENYPSNRTWKGRMKRQTNTVKEPKNNNNSIQKQLILLYLHYIVSNSKNQSD